MAHNKARSDKLVRAEDGTFGCIWGYIMDAQPIEMCLEDRFFESCKNNLLPGDQIRVTELKGRDEKKTVTATVTLIVMRKDAKTVYVEKYEGKNIHRYEFPEDTEAPKTSADQDFNQAPVYVEETAQIEKTQDGIFQVKTSKGVVAETKVYGEAVGMAKGDIPINKPA